MTSVFIGGSRRLGRLNVEFQQRLGNIIQSGFRVLIGDANGVDRAVQAYLAKRRYRSVRVYCTNGECRNNVGGWPTQVVTYLGRDHGREYYTAKDDAMLADAEYGLFSWDGKSEGTLRNIRKMAEREKPSAIYLSTARKFIVVRNDKDLSAVIEGGDPHGTPVDLFSGKWNALARKSVPLAHST